MVALLYSHIFENEGYTFAEHTIKFTYQGAEGNSILYQGSCV
jgi:hypothetical protein